MSTSATRGHGGGQISTKHNLASRSCAECSRRKAKCDYVLPRCGRCLHRNIPCYFPTRKRPGPRKGFTRGPVQVQKNQEIIEPLPDTTCKGLVTTATVHNLDYSIGGEDEEGNFSYGHSGPSEGKTSLKGSCGSENAKTQSQQFIYDMVERPIETDDFSLQELRSKLVHVYLANAYRLFPCFPVFPKSQLLGLLTSTDENIALIDSICAIAAMFSDESCLVPQKHNFAVADEFAARAKLAHLEQSYDESAQINIAVIKASHLLTLYSYVRHPGLKGWAMAGETIRLAYEYGLDKQDRHAEEVQGVQHEESSPQALSAIEREDRRLLWWSIWKMDVTYSGLSSRPFGIDSRGIETCLPSSSFLDLITGRVSSTKQTYMTSDYQKATKQFQNLDLSSIADVQTFYFIAHSFVRSASELRRLNLACQDVNHEMFLLELSLSALQVSLPVIANDSYSIPGENSQIAKDRILLEATLLAHLSSIILYMPNCKDLAYSQTITTPLISTSFLPQDRENKVFHGLWYKCSRAANAIVDIVMAMSAQTIAFLSPTASSSLWLAGVILTLQRAIVQDTKARDTLSSSTTLLLAVLKRIGKTWPCASALHDSLESITARLATPMTTIEIDRLLRKWNGWAGTRTSSSSLLFISSDGHDTHAPRPPSQPPSTGGPRTEPFCSDAHLPFDTDLGFASFNDDFWAMDDFLLTATA